MIIRLKVTLLIGKLYNLCSRFQYNFATVISASGEVLREEVMVGLAYRLLRCQKWGSKMRQLQQRSKCNGVGLAYLSQTEPKLENDGWIWMLHGDTGVDNFRPYSEGDEKNTDPKDWIYSGAHLMLMPKDPNSLGSQTTDFTTGAPYVMMKGTPYVHLMIPVEGYYDYQPESAPK